METAAGRLLALRGLVSVASRACPGAAGQRAQSCRQIVAECMCVRPSCPPRGGFGSLLPVQSKIPGWNRLKTQLRPSAPVAPLSWCLQAFLESQIQFPSPSCAGSALRCPDLSVAVVLPPRGSPRHPVPTSNLWVVWRVVVLRIWAAQMVRKHLSRRAPPAITFLRPTAAAAAHQEIFQM